MYIDDEILELIEMEKVAEEGLGPIDAPTSGNKVEIKLKAPSSPGEKFTLSIFEGARSSSVSVSIYASRKTTLQTRRLQDPLVRVDIDDKAVHTNPDGSIVRGSHVHIASVECGCRFAYPIGSEEFIMVTGGGSDIPEVFESFREFCHIEGALTINWTLGV